MRIQPASRVLAFVLALVMVLGLAPVSSAAASGLRWQETKVAAEPDRSHRLVTDIEKAELYRPGDTIRVSIVLEDDPTVGAGFSTMGIARNPGAIGYDLELNRVQKAMEQEISRRALGGKKLDVVWNLTLVANIISANVPWEAVDAIRAVPGVREVRMERQYSPDTAQPQTAVSGGMIGSHTVWQSGYTGAGSRIAIVDTGTDTDHQSFDNDAFLYALRQNAEEEGLSYERYLSEIDLLDAGDVNLVLEHLNVTERIGYDDASSYYLNEKLPFAANYVDRNLVVDHDHDGQGSHGSHVAGIAAANRFIYKSGSYVDARQEVFMAGAAPDAQIITMKVFGNADGPYDSDYFAAIEDAIWLGCDSVNLSLGSGTPGSSYNENFADLLEFLATTDTVVVMSAGNSGFWAEQTVNGKLYSDGVSFHTSGEPGTYTNSLSVASVDSDGVIGYFFTVADRTVVYNESDGYRNRAMRSLDTTGQGKEMDYVFVDGIGTEEDYAGIDLNGKVVFCSRGETSFSEKANVAARLGAAAVVICNNQSGVIGMDLSDYAYVAPCVSITRADAKAIRAASQAQTTASGNAYYTGRLTICSGKEASQYYSEYQTMSSFSSWGVPGSLELKPEITAPGGNIWSVDGVDTSGKAYEFMSGTSMAAPQVSGLAALMAQYILESGLAEKTGLTPRQLTQSLLMSTAVPLREEASGGNYYSVLSQGAGLARVDLASSAESFVLVEGMEDGKVKVELGEDPGREGKYTFSFTIHNLSGKAMTYDLRADLFTQNVVDGGDAMYLDTATRALDARAVFSCDGRSLADMGNFACDLNGDGVTNAADADYLLEYLVGNAGKLHADGDVDKNGEVNTYDAHVLLTRQTGGSRVEVAANGSATVEVELTLTADARAMLEKEYPAGAYIEGFVWAEPQADAEGAAGVSHSIPVLGYYGSWTEPGMFDVGGYVERESGLETRMPYLYELNGDRYNYVSVTYGDGYEYLFGGNPLPVEEEYLPQRNAFNNEKGGMLQNLRFALIRNAAATRLVLKDLTNGETLFSEPMGAAYGAYYHVNAGQWSNTLGRMGLGLGLEGIPENTTLELRLEAAPELYRNADGSVDWTKLQEGGVLSTTFTIDNTAPQVMDIHQEGGSLLVTAKDNQYIAGVALLNASGTGALTMVPGNQLTANTAHTLSLDLGGIYGSSFQVAVYDYAENVTVCRVELELANERPRFTVADQTTGDWYGLSAEGTCVSLTSGGNATVQAAEYVDGYVFRVDGENRLYVTSDEDLYGFRLVSELDPEDKYQIVNFNDLAYSTQDQILYGNFYSETNDLRAPYLCTIDLFTGEMTVLRELAVDVNNMTIDDEGNFYGVPYGLSQLYTFRADASKVNDFTLVGSMGSYNSVGNAPLAWDHETDELFWTQTDSYGTKLLKLDPKTAEAELLAEAPFRAAGLYIAGSTLGDTFAPTDWVSAVVLLQTARTLTGSTVQLSARVLPWNVSDDSVIWSSGNPNVATVDGNGLVTGVSGGTAVITAASKLDSGVKATCTVTVEELGGELKGLVWDETGEVWFSSFNPGSLPEYEKLAANDLPLATTAFHNGTLYAGTIDVVNGLSDLYTVDPETFALTKVGGSRTIAYMDLCYAPKLGYLVATYFNYLALVDPATGEYIGAIDWTDGVAGDLVGITWIGSQYNENYSAWMDIFMILDNEGNVYEEAIMPYQGGYATFNGPEAGLIGSMGAAVDYSYFQGFHFDGSNLYWSRFNEADNVVELRVMDVLGDGSVYHLGYFPEGVWPVGGLYTDAQIAANAMTAKYADARVREQVFTESVPNAGGLNAAELHSSAQIQEKLVYVDVTLPADAPSADMTVSFDTDKLELVNVEESTAAFAWKRDQGVIDIALAEGLLIPADEAVARLAFRPLDEGVTSLAVNTDHLGSQQYENREWIALELPSLNPFTDVPEDGFYYEPVLWAVKEGITTGVTDTTFNPGGDCMRGHVVTFLWRAMGSPEPKTTVNPFVDVKTTDYFYKAVLWAYENGITNGLDSTHFAPTGLCNRAQVVTFLWRAMGSPTPTTSQSTFTDVTGNAWYVAPVLWAVENGITNGMGDGIFGVESICNRAQVVTFLYRTLK